MKETGTVIKENDDLAEVIFTRKSACGENCANCSAMCREKKHIAKVRNAIGAKVGDKVCVFTNDRASYLALALVFILPVILFIAAFILVNSILKSYMAATVISLLLLTFYLFILKRFEKKIAPIPEITEILSIGKDEINGA